MAFLAIEMAMHFFGGAVMVVVAETILFLTAAILYFVHHMMLGEERKGPENRTAVDGLEKHLHVIDAESIADGGDGPAYKSAHGSDMHSVLFEYLVRVNITAHIVHNPAKLSSFGRCSKYFR